MSLYNYWIRSALEQRLPIASSEHTHIMVLSWSEGEHAFIAKSPHGIAFCRLAARATRFLSWKKFLSIDVTCELCRTGKWMLK